MKMHYDYDEIYCYQKGILPEQEKNAVRSHLESCKECAAKLEKASRLSSLFGAANEPVPGRIFQNIMNETGSGKGLFGYIFKPRFVVAASFAVVMFISIVAVKNTLDAKKDPNLSGYIYDTYETVFDQQYNNDKYLDKIDIMNTTEGDQL
jgi:anti-sigma factor RsiW